MLPEVEALYLDLLDPVSHTCLALTCKKFYFAYKESIPKGKKLMEGIAFHGLIELIPWAEAELHLQLDFTFLETAAKVGRILVFEWFLALPKQTLDRLERLNGSINSHVPNCVYWAAANGQLDLLKYLHAKWENCLPSPLIFTRMTSVNRAQVMAWIIEIGEKKILDGYSDRIFRESLLNGDVESLDLCRDQGWFAAQMSDQFRKRLYQIKDVRSFEWLLRQNIRLDTKELHELYDYNVRRRRLNLMQWCEKNGAKLISSLGAIAYEWLAREESPEGMVEIIEHLLTLGYSLDDEFLIHAIEGGSLVLFKLFFRTRGTISLDHAVTQKVADSLIHGPFRRYDLYAFINLAEKNPEALLDFPVDETAAEMLEFLLEHKVPWVPNSMELALMSLFRETDNLDIWSDGEDHDNEVFISKRFFSVIRFLQSRGLGFTPQCFDAVLERRVLSLVKFLVDECDCPWRAAVLNDFLSDNGINDIFDWDLAQYLLSLGCECSEENLRYLEETEDYSLDLDPTPEFD